jgi:L-asparagine oxygenase
VLREITVPLSTTRRIVKLASLAERSAPPVEIGATLAPHLPVEAHRALADFRHPWGGGALLIHGVGPGPVPAGAVRHSDLPAAGLLLSGIVSLVATLATVPTEWDGDPLTDVKATPGLEDTVSSKGLKALPLHQEDQHLNLPPDGLALLMVTGGNPIRVAATTAIVDDLRNRDERQAIGALRRSEFVHHTPLSFGGTGVSRPTPVLCGPEGKPELKVDLATTMGITESGKSALAALARSADLAAFDVHLAPGDLLLLDNRRWLHGRGKLDSSSTDRWLIRCLLIFDSWRVDRDGPTLDAQGVRVAA